MTRIAMLQGKDQIDRVFTHQHIEKLRSLGEVIMNEQAGPPSKETVRKLIEGADIAITSWGCTALDEKEFDLAPKLKAVLHAAGSIKGIVTPGLWVRGIRVSNGAMALGKGVAETALGMTIASLKNMWRLSQETKSGQWVKTSSIRELFEITVGVVGAGSAGKHFIKLLQNFDVNVLVLDPMISEADAQKLGAAKCEWNQLLAQSDVISIHAPLLPSTKHMFNKESLSSMKDHCILINTANGGIIDEQALIEELSKGRLFACIDVTNPEPPAVDHPFRSLPNVILTPHIAGAVNNGLHRIARLIIDDLQLLLNGQPMQGEVTSEQLSYLA